MAAVASASTGPDGPAAAAVATAAWAALRSATQQRKQQHRLAAAGDTDVEAGPSERAQVVPRVVASGQIRVTRSPVRSLSPSSEGNPAVTSGAAGATVAPPPAASTSSSSSASGANSIPRPSLPEVLPPNVKAALKRAAAAVRDCEQQEMAKPAVSTEPTSQRTATAIFNQFHSANDDTAEAPAESARVVDAAPAMEGTARPRPSAPPPLLDTSSSSGSAPPESSKGETNPAAETPPGGGESSTTRYTSGLLNLLVRAYAKRGRPPPELCACVRPPVSAAPCVDSGGNLSQSLDWEVYVQRISNPASHARNCEFALSSARLQRQVLVLIQAAKDK
eukprot:gnl/TRDRNA2_/TRDRNA2_97923_c0_seq2.p1 gnl/TRDRNA2_/TRDRNA2_97923_c0~~gnl/TRDRNA2_/TRDRNA2_97923_c0_seq2.p1  ORF type:complete len:335 (+),score=59.46 gnl/TRDRNA2_/TRDRNA2_97923_c0_seq2:109-1113(+)